VVAESERESELMFHPTHSMSFRWRR